MDIKRLHPYVTKEFDSLRTHLDNVFDVMRHRATKGYTTSTNTLVRYLKEAGQPHKVAVRSAKSPLPFRTLYSPNLWAECRQRGDVVLWVGTPEDQTTFPAHVPTWNYFQYRVYKMLQHECVHRAQFALESANRRSYVFKPTEDESSTEKDAAWYRNQQKYLGDLDEVEAYARDVVEEWYYLYPTTPITARRIQTTFAQKNSIATLTFYHAAFRGNAKHPALRRLFQKILAWNALITPMSTYLPPAPDVIVRHPRKRTALE